MLVPEKTRNLVGNKLLASLPQEEYERILPKLEHISLPLKKYLYHGNEEINYVYFPNAGVVSVTTVSEEGKIIEVATIGNEGMVGTSILLGVNYVPNETFVQVPGDALRMKVDVFLSEVPLGSPLYNLGLRYTQALINQIMQTAACNRLHPIEERCCRWLLMTHDRARSDDFPLTQEFFAQMLGVRRASVSLVAATLQKAGLINYSRGKIKVLAREGLEASSCECYRTITQEYKRLLGC